jgi:mono/diheme cytochrome c family protein
MRATFLAILSLLLFLVARSSIIVSGAQSAQTAQKASARVSDNDAGRGRYLVEEVAKCSECHTPRDAQNQLDRSRWLQGASIWIEPVHPVLNWAQFAPPLAGLPGLSDEQMQRVLEKGQSANGREIQPPMHLYHLNHADAQAVIAYLRSIPAPTIH